MATCNDDDEGDEELLALLQASQLEARAPADALQDGLGALCSKPAVSVARDPPSTAGQQGTVLQEQHSTPAAEACTVSTSDEPAGKSWHDDCTCTELYLFVANFWDSSEVSLHLPYGVHPDMYIPSAQADGYLQG